FNADDLSPHRRVVQRLFYPRVRQVEPLLQKVNPQHALYSHRRPPLPRLGIMRRHQRTQLAPRHHLLHLFQIYRSPRLPRVLLKAGHHRQSPLFHLSDTLTCQLWKAESLIRVSLDGSEPCCWRFQGSSRSWPMLLSCCFYPRRGRKIKALTMSNITNQWPRSWPRALVYYWVLSQPYVIHQASLCSMRPHFGFPTRWTSVTGQGCAYFNHFSYLPAACWLG